MLKRGAVRARHAQHVAEAGRDDVRLGGQIEAAFDVAFGRDADRAARAGEQFDAGWQQALDAVVADRVGVAAADLHQPHLAAQRLGALRYTLDQTARQFRVAVLVNMLHER